MDPATIILAAGALGMAASGIVETLKRRDTRREARLPHPCHRQGLEDRTTDRECGNVVAAATSKMPREDLSSEARDALAQFELAVDARIDAALTLSLDHYQRAARIWASAVAILIALAAGTTVGIEVALLIGVLAVPLAPVAKDVASAIKAAADVLRARS
jgi:hypothetical protein